MNLMQESAVKYVCSCGILNPINKLFFCRHCPKLRCGSCVCHEVESHFCSNCLENIPSSEARHKKNCCANCFDCPCCQHTLSARATTVAIIKKPSEEGAGDSETTSSSSSTKTTATKKMYYLSCLSCRWTSRDAGIPDQSVASGTWPDSECIFQSRFNALLEYYQALVLQEKQEKQEYLRRKAPKIHKFPTLTDRTGLTVSMIRRQIGWSDKTLQPAKPINIAQSVAEEDVEELPADIFTQKINLRNVTTIAQRHSQPSEQPYTVNKLYPQRRSLWIKRSLRCKQCEHNLIKPEYHPTSIKYRIQLFASYHVPEVLLVRLEQPIQAGKLCAALVKLTNPTMFDMTITIMELGMVQQEIEDEEKIISAMKELRASKGDNDEKQMTSTPTKITNQTTSAPQSRMMALLEKSRLARQTANAKLEMLDSSFVLNQRDDSKEFDEDVQEQREEPKFIVWRKGNKVLIRLKFIPDANLQMGDKVTVGLVMQNTYVNTVSNTPDKKEPTTHALNTKIFIEMGNIGENQ